MASRADLIQDMENMETLMIQAESKKDAFQTAFYWVALALYHVLDELTRRKK